MNPGVTIRPLGPADAEACDRIIASLPYHFGDSAGRAECAEAVRSRPGLVACLEGRPVGFLTVERHGPESAEITWLAVEDAGRGRGIGTALVRELCRRLRGDGCRLMLVHTLAESLPEPGVVDGYARTRAFYRRLGFISAREYPDLWPSSPAQLFVLPLGPALPGESP